MTFLNHIFSAIMIPVIMVTGFLFGNHKTSQPPVVPIVQEATTSPATPSPKIVSVSQNENHATKTKETPQSNSASSTANNNTQITPPAPQPTSISTLSPTTSPNTISCNGSNWPACPAGQQFICANDGIKPYCQIPPPAATATQIAEIAQLCSYATSQGNAAVIQYCTDGSILNGYNTNAIFRSDIDILSQQLQQKIARQQTALNNQIYVQNWISALNTASQINQSFVSQQNAINAEAAAEQQRQQNAQILQMVEKNQQLLQQMANTPVQTHCGIDAGVFSCNIQN